MKPPIETWANEDGETATLERLDVGRHRLRVFHGGRLVASFMRNHSVTGNSPAQVLEWAEKQLRANFYVLTRTADKHNFKEPT